MNPVIFRSEELFKATDKLSTKSLLLVGSTLLLDKLSLRLRAKWNDRLSKAVDFLAILVREFNLIGSVPLVSATLLASRLQEVSSVVCASRSVLLSHELVCI